MGDPQATAVGMRLLPIVAVLLAIGAVLLGLIGLRGGAQRRARLWTAYATEFGMLAVVLVPAYVSLAALLAACLVIGVTATRELSATLRVAGATPWSRLESVSGPLRSWRPVLGATGGCTPSSSVRRSPSFSPLESCGP